MRLLEACASSWLMPEMEKQILALREAFSADITKPFELKADFARSPYISDGSSSPVSTQITATTPPIELSAQPQQSGSYINHPPMASFMDAQDYPTPDSTNLGVGMEQGQYYPDLQHQGNELLFSNEIGWNPAPIFQ